MLTEKTAAGGAPKEKDMLDHFLSEKEHRASMTEADVFVETELIL